MTTGSVDGRRRRWRLAAFALVLVASLAVVADIPVTTRQGVNFEVTEHRLPLYLKSFEFLDRDAQYRQLAGEITRGAASDEARVLAVFDWTARRIQPQPEGWPIVDDHILNIVIRGYGMADQRADVFATLTTYAGVPAFWQKVRAPRTTDGVIFTFVRLDGRWVVIDVANKFVFRNTHGELASTEDFVANRALLPEAAQSRLVGSTPYAEIAKHVGPLVIPRPLRAELQMFWPRLLDVTLRTIGYRHDDGSQ
jgi:hypothetical protein